MKVRIPAVTIDIDEKVYELNYGPEDTRADIIQYFLNQIYAALPIEEGYARVVKVHSTKGSHVQNPPSIAGHP